MLRNTAGNKFDGVVCILHKFYYRSLSIIRAFRGRALEGVMEKECWLANEEKITGLLVPWVATMARLAMASVRGFSGGGGAGLQY